jgi:RNA polymerase sigma-70 factor (ECF subfamily)
VVNGPDAGARRSDDPGSAAPAERRYCLLPADLAPRLERLMLRWSAEHDIQVVLDRRQRSRRTESDRRAEPWPGEDDAPYAVPGPFECRRIRNRAGRRVAERRATLIPVSAPAELPRRALVEADRLAFVERIDLGAEYLEDADSARLIIRLQAGDDTLFAALYERYFDRVYSYLRVALHDRHEAEDAAQQVFLQVMEALARYEVRDVPFRAWLFRIVRNYALNHLEKHGRIAVEDPVELDRRREVEIGDLEPRLLDWLSDTDLIILVGRLPLAQRQVMMLRYMMDMSWSQIADVVGRSPAAVRQLQARALTQLRARLAATGRELPTSARMPMVRRPCSLPVLNARRFALLAA